MSKIAIEEAKMIEPRADFNPITIEKLYKSTGGLCSRCGRMTTAYDHDTDEHISIGEAAHIFGAKRTSGKSPRSNPALTNSFMKSFENGIWVCRNCHKLIDDNEKGFNSQLLQRMKKQASTLALDSLKRAVEFHKLVQNDNDPVNKIESDVPYTIDEINGIKILNSVSLKGFNIYDDCSGIKSKRKLIRFFREFKIYYRNAYQNLSEVHLTINKKDTLNNAINNALKLVSNIQTHIDVAINMYKKYNTQDFVDILHIIKDNSFSIRFALRWL